MYSRINRKSSRGSTHQDVDEESAKPQSEFGDIQAIRRSRCNYAPAFQSDSSAPIQGAWQYNYEYKLGFWMPDGTEKTPLPEGYVEFTHEPAKSNFRWTYAPPPSSAMADDSVSASGAGRSGGSRRAFDVSDSRKRVERDIPFPDVAFDEAAVLGEWDKLNTKKFYEKTRRLLQVARDPSDEDNATSVAILDQLVSGYQGSSKIKNRIDGYVRVNATKGKGMASGAGLDELFKTSETMTFLTLSYKPPADMSATATYKGGEFDWMDAQQQVRLSTELIMWAGDLVNTISGHTGTYQREFRGVWGTEKQALMHEVRHEHIISRSNPAGAILQALAVHLRITENVEAMASELYSQAEAKKMLLPNGYTIEEQLSEITDVLGRNRDKIKLYYRELESNSVAHGGASPIAARFGDDDRKEEEEEDDALEASPLSPMREEPASPLALGKGRVPGNVLPALAPQARVDWEAVNSGKSPRTIPPRPINPLIVKARQEMVKLLGSPEATKINNSAKGFVKRGALEGVEADKIILSTYIDKLGAKRSTSGVTKLIASIEEDLKALDE